MNTCKCTCENPTCSCTPTEVTAFKDKNGKLFKTKEEAYASDITDCVLLSINGPSVSMYGIKRYDVEQVLKALVKLDLLKMN